MMTIKPIRNEQDYDWALKLSNISKPNPPWPRPRRPLRSGVHVNRGL